MRTKGVDYPGVTIVFYCHDGKGNFVMSKRGRNARDERGKWEIGGGALDFGIGVIETLKKEIKEEYGADVLAHEFLGYRDIHRVSDGKPTHWVSLDFKVLVDPNQVHNGEPHKFDAVEFFTLDTLPTPQHSQLQTFIRLYRDQMR